MAKFRFQDFEIWKISIELADKLFDIAEKVEGMKHYRNAEQLRASILSVSNNIAEGSGSFSNKEFAYFLNIARRSVFETANILLLFQKKDIITEEELEKYLEDLEILSKKITNFRKSLI